MPTFRFALEPGGPKRLVITMPVFAGATLIDLDGEPVGTIPSKPALGDGRAFGLPDGRDLHVAYRKGFGFAEWVLTIDGKPLPGSGGDVHTQVKTAAGAFFFLAAVALAIGVASLIWTDNALLQRLGGIGGLVLAPIMGVFGWLTRRGSFWACAIGGSVVLLDTLSIPFVAATTPGSPPVGGLIMRAYLLVAVYRGARTLWEQRKVGRGTSNAAKGVG